LPEPQTAEEPRCDSSSPWILGTEGPRSQKVPQMAPALEVQRHCSGLNTCVHVPATPLRFRQSSRCSKTSANHEWHGGPMTPPAGGLSTTLVRALGGSLAPCGFLRRDCQRCPFAWVWVRWILPRSHFLSWAREQRLEPRALPSSCEYQRLTTRDQFHGTCLSGWHSS
jgi:hypothetical protein